MPRARFRIATSSIEPSRVVRMTDMSSDIGLRSTTAAWRGSSAGIRRRSTRSGAANTQPHTSHSPAPARASSARRRRRCSGASTPVAPRREGSV